MKPKNLLGLKFGKLKPQKYLKDGKWECICDCGNIKIVKSNHLQSGSVQSCGCLRKESTRLIDLKGQKFGKLLVIEESGRKRKEAVWKCVCDCGKTINVNSYSLRNGKTKSCGCLKIDEFKKRSTTHNKSKTRLYAVYKAMKARCYNKNTNRYNLYGGKGIKICDQWLLDFESFYIWAIAHGYNENAERGQCTIDRINPNGDYSPENCRWVDMSIQSTNKCDSKKIEFRGERHTITEWSKILKIKQPTLSFRLSHGWDVEKAFTTK